MTQTPNGRTPYGRTPYGRAASALMTALVLGVPLPAAANPQLVEEHVPTITVRSTDAQSYDQVKGTVAAFGLMMSGSCENGKKLLSAGGEIEDWPASSSSIYVDDLPHNATGLPPKLLRVPHWLLGGPASSLPGWLQQAAIQRCTENKQQAMATQGLSAAQVFAKQWSLPAEGIVMVRGRLRCEPTCAGGGFCSETFAQYTARVPARAAVHCEKFAFTDLVQPPTPPHPPGPGDLTIEHAVTAATIAVDPDQATVFTEANLTVEGSLAVNAKGTVRFRVNHNGGLGPISTLSFGGPGPKPVSFPLTIRCPQEGDHEAPSGGGIGGMTAAPSNVKNGTVRLEIVSPTGGVERSNVAAYSVTCKETGTLATPLPDLTIIDVRAGAAGRAASVKALVRVRNIGAAGAPATLVRAQRQGVPSTEAPVPALAAGDSHDVEILVPAAGAVKSAVLFRVDPANAVRESNEGNNTHSQ